jgi:hypothetical protein
MNLLVFACGSWFQYKSQKHIIIILEMVFRGTARQGRPPNAAARSSLSGAIVVWRLGDTAGHVLRAHQGAQIGSGSTHTRPMWGASAAPPHILGMFSHTGSLNKNTLIN